MTVPERLYELRDEGNAAFMARLLPGVAPERILGVRTPEIRRVARDFQGTEEAARFLAALPHETLDENGVHAFLIEKIRDFDECLAAVERFLPYVDNWATCDSLRPKVFARHKAELLGHIRRWLDSEETYTRRFGLEMLMCHYLDEAFDPLYLDWAAALRSEEYYVNMMIAWYFATALAKQYDYALPYLEQRRLDKWTHNKSIQKALESYRVCEERKAYLKTLKIRENPSAACGDCSPRTGA